MRRAHDCLSTNKQSNFILGVLDQQSTYEVFRQFAGVAKVFFIKVIIDSRDVGEGLLLGFAKKR